MITLLCLFIYALIFLMLFVIFGATLLFTLLIEFWPILLIGILISLIL